MRGDLVLYKGHPWRDVCSMYDRVYLYNLSTGENRCLLPADKMHTGAICLGDEQALLAATDRERSAGTTSITSSTPWTLASGA